MPANRLTSSEFLQKLRKSDKAWIGIVSHIPGIVLVVPDESGGEVVYFGPDPFEYDDLDSYKAFATEAMKIVMSRAEKRKETDG